jgi:hypothetical protein
VPGLGLWLPRFKTSS